MFNVILVSFHRESVYLVSFFPFASQASTIHYFLDLNKPDKLDYGFSSIVYTQILFGNEIWILVKFN